MRTFLLDLHPSPHAKTCFRGFWRGQYGADNLKFESGRQWSPKWPFLKKLTMANHDHSTQTERVQAYTYVRVSTKKFPRPGKIFLIFYEVFPRIFKFFIFEVKICQKWKDTDRGGFGEFWHESIFPMFFECFANFSWLWNPNCGFLPHPVAPQKSVAQNLSPMVAKPLLY